MAGCIKYDIVVVALSIYHTHFPVALNDCSGPNVRGWERTILYFGALATLYFAVLQMSRCLQPTVREISYALMLVSL